MHKTEDTYYFGDYLINLSKANNRLSIEIIVPSTNQNFSIELDNDAIFPASQGIFSDVHAMFQGLEEAIRKTREEIILDVNGKGQLTYKVELPGGKSSQFTIDLQEKDTDTLAIFERRFEERFEQISQRVSRVELQNDLHEKDIAFSNRETFLISTTHKTFETRLGLLEKRVFERFDMLEKRIEETKVSRAELQNVLDIVSKLEIKLLETKINPVGTLSVSEPSENKIIEPKVNPAETSPGSEPSESKMSEVRINQPPSYAKPEESKMLDEKVKPVSEPSESKMSEAKINPYVQSSSDAKPEETKILDEKVKPVLESSENKRLELKEKTFIQKSLFGDLESKLSEAKSIAKASVSSLSENTACFIPCRHTKDVEFSNQNKTIRYNGLRAGEVPLSKPLPNSGVFKLYIRLLTVPRYIWFGLVDQELLGSNSSQDWFEKNYIYSTLDGSICYNRKHMSILQDKEQNKGKAGDVICFIIDIDAEIFSVQVNGFEINSAKINLQNNIYLPYCGLLGKNCKISII